MVDAYGLFQIRLLYHAAYDGDGVLACAPCAEIFRTYADKGNAFCHRMGDLRPRIVALAFPAAQVMDASVVVVPAILQGVALMVLRSLAPVELARRRFVMIVAMVATAAAAAAMLGAWRWGADTCSLVFGAGQLRNHIAVVDLDRDGWHGPFAPDPTSPIGTGVTP